MSKHPHNPEYLTEQQRAVVDDVCLHTVSDADHWARVRAGREARVERLHQEVIAAKARFDASRSPADEVAFNEAFERWIAA